MIGSNLFRKHFAIAAVSVLGFVFAGSVLSTLFIQRVIQNRSFQAPMFFVHVIEDMGKGDPVAGVKKVENYQDGEMPFSFSVLDESGKVLYGESPESALPALPASVHETAQVGDKNRFGLPEGFLVRLDHSPARYLYIHGRTPMKRAFIGRPHREGPPPPGGPHMMGPDGPRPPGPLPGGPGMLGGLMRFPPLFSMAFVTLVLTVLVGIGFALFLIFRSLREHVQTADRVISELQKGNLKARFPIAKNDEIGKAMVRFNQMADQIEQLVERVRSAEASRNFLLQELTHDLRTPVASMRSLLDTVFSSVKMDGEIEELAELAVKENDYIAQLVEDLLLLAQVSEPRYKPQQAKVDLVALIEEEGTSLELRRKKESIQFRMESTEEEAFIAGDEQLLRRLVRNSLENAFSFASGSVAVTLRKNGEKIAVRVEDDGPGFDPESLITFGERRNQRMVPKTKGGRLSIGLGSVIMKTVVLLHGGEIQASNTARGGAVDFSLPLAN
jgi:signal transduction histidine kinase